MPLRLIDPCDVDRTGREEQPGKDFLDDGAHRRKCEGIRRTAAEPFGLQEGVRDGTDHHVVMPPWVGAPFEMIETQFGLEVLVMLFDRPARVSQPNQSRKRGSGRQVAEIVFPDGRSADGTLAEQPQRVESVRSSSGFLRASMSR